MLAGTTTDYQREALADKVRGFIPVEEEESDDESIIDMSDE